MGSSITGRAEVGRRSQLSRRQWLQLTSAGAMGVSLSGWLEPWVAAATDGGRRARSCILLWMAGGPSQADTFDLKPGHADCGSFKEIATVVPGIKIGEHLPRVAKWMKHMAIIRSMSTGESGGHEPAHFLMHTGYLPMGGIQYPPLGSLVSKELGRANAVLPNYVNIIPESYPLTHGSGFLDSNHGPLLLGDNVGARTSVPVEQLFQVPHLVPSKKSAFQDQHRLALLQQSHQAFVTRYGGTASRSHQTAYERAVRLMRSGAGKAFELEKESGKIRDGYGRNLFGQGCLLARRLVEHGVPFVEVGFNVPSNSPWDTHDKNAMVVPQLSSILDPAWAQLMQDLHERGLLDTTLIVWMGEFGRTPLYSKYSDGRDHYAAAWSTVLAGGGIRGGQVVGKTSANGMEVKERPVSAGDFLATICLALGMNPKKTNSSNTDRPIPLVDEKAQPLQELLN